MSAYQTSSNLLAYLSRKMNSCAICKFTEDDATMFAFCDKYCCHYCCSPPESFFWSDDDWTEEDNEEAIEDCVKRGEMVLSNCGRAALDTKDPAHIKLLKMIQ
mgnify:CR=1 FL=1